MIRSLALWAGIIFIISAVAVNVTGGAFGSIVRLTLSALGFMWVLHRFPRFRFRTLPPPAIVLVLIVLMSYLSAVWSVSPDESIFAGYRLLLVFVTVFLIYDIFRSAKEVWMAMQAYIFGLIFLFAQIFLSFLQGRVTIDEGRIGAEGIHPNHAAVMLATGLPIAWQLANDRRFRNPITTVFNFAYPLIAIFGVLLTGSRGGSLACVPGLLFIGYQIVQNPIGIVAVGIGSAVGIPALLTSPIIQANIERLSSVSENDKFTGRGERWQAAIDLFSSSPIYGVGAGGYRIGAFRIGNYGFGDGGAFLGAHSVYLQYASELGIIGVSLFILMLLLTLRRFWRIEPGYRAAFVIGLFSLMIAMISEMLDARYFVWCYIGIGLALAAVPRRKEVAVNPPRALDHVPQPEPLARPMSGVGHARS
ncbi:MAG: O-antigen ligase family protein [Fimbriimonadaceae bacterium]|nr:O-antigen ligase family protein [Fimbriimonadaceae bacterium]